MEPKHNSQMLGESNCYCAPVDGCDLNLSNTSKVSDATMGKHASLDCVRRELLSVREMEEKVWEEEATEDVVPETKMTGKRCRSSATTQEQGGKIPRQCGTGPSSFIPNSEIQGVENGADEQVREIFTDVFVQSQRLDHLTAVMGLHPQYLAAFCRTQDFMLRGNGPLPYDYRNYIAILTAARHRCSYVMGLQESEFLSQGGDREWLQGLEHVPPKIQDLYELIKLLSHRPWLITQELIEKLLKGPHNWTLSELVQACVLISHFTSLPSFIYGCGINPEIDMDGGHTLRPPSLTDESGLSNNNKPNEESAGGNVEELVQKMKNIEKQSDTEDSQEEKVKKFEKVREQSGKLLPRSPGSCGEREDITPFVQDPSFLYEDFARRGENSQFQTFRAQDYTWEDQGYSLVNRYYPDVSQLMDDKLGVAYNMTYNTMGHKKQVDTSLLRRAIWNYIHSLYGIRHDDYDYGEINELLDRQLKTYIKTIACYPDRTTKHDYDSFWLDFKHSEKVHVNVMVLEARIQASLLYCLRAIMRYMT
ncbi:sestrin-1 isoform X2 [Strongylocentrotus purpuratus]|uniref:Sestrin n=1 Tax=Strongylocentrotus purpuratus TaxID=7668 RepID=A0A7M7PHA6_STRPU|nr:sestrin-1 isoform X2 [Strongylocentrotus purpuratus]